LRLFAMVGVAAFGRRLGEVARNRGHFAGCGSGVLGGVAVFGGAKQAIYDSPS
jgi:hypothetical protein